MCGHIREQKLDTWSAVEIASVTFIWNIFRSAKCLINTMQNNIILYAG
jgi:hypothetical protein